MQESEFKPRGYQIEILERIFQNTKNGYNSIVELDCGTGKRFIQYELINTTFKNEKILLLLHASSSLYETFRYFKELYGLKNVELIDSRLPSIIRAKKLQESKLVLCLPQTLVNTLKAFPNCIDNYGIFIINEIDQIIRRTSISTSIKSSYFHLLNYFKKKTVVGMSGTLRDEHYVQDAQQLFIREELRTLKAHIPNSLLISMDQLEETDFNKYKSMSYIIPTGVEDNTIINLSTEVDAHIKEASEEVISAVQEIDPKLAKELKSSPQAMFNKVLPIEDELLRKFHHGYLVRKYIWALPGEQSLPHLYSYGLDKNWVRETVIPIPQKFNIAFSLAMKEKKTIILCSYLSSCDLLERKFNNALVKTIKITGKVQQHLRDKMLEKFQSETSQMVAIISNVGERDLDIPNTDLLIVFDLVRTVKTVYQKLKRSRGGNCRILYYTATNEEKKVSSVTSKLMQRYYWTTELKPKENF